MFANRSFSRILIALLLSTTFMLSACGNIELGVTTPEPSNISEEIPEGVMIAREFALIYLREAYGDAAPPAGLQWQGVFVSQEGLVGAGAYQFTAAPWEMLIEYPIVAPEATIYTISLINEIDDFMWQGQVDALGEVTELASTDQSEEVIAWLGHIATLPEGSGADDVFILSPEGAGAVGIAGVDESVDASIVEVRDGEGPLEFVHVWGTLECGVDDYNGCRLTARRVRYGATITEPEPVEGWEGVIFTRTQAPGSGGDDFFVLLGDYPVEYGIWSQDEVLRGELESLRDTQTVVRIWGELVAGIPDWAGTQIRVERFEIVERPGVGVPPQPTQQVVDRGWETYVNERYGYQIQYPPQATLEEMGIHGFPSDEQGNPVGDIPEGLSPDEVIDYLLETYGENLCVQITYALGYITISVPENEEFRYATCGRTGVGAGELIPKEEMISIDGMEVLASGFEFSATYDTGDVHDETLHLTLPDGTRIEYGSGPGSEATYQDYLNKGKPMILEILSTYQSR